MKHLLLLGGGHSHVEVLRRLGLQPPAGTRITLVSPDRHTPYSGMLPGLVAGHYGFHDCHIDLERLARFAGACFVRASAIDVDPARRRVALAGAGDIDYDVLSIDIGSVPAGSDAPGVREHAIGLKPVAGFLGRWETLLRDAQSPLRIAVVGGGAAGVEILLAMQHRLAQTTHAAPARFLLISDSARLLAGHAPAAGALFERVLRRRNVELHSGSRVRSVEPGTAVMADGRRIAASAVVWATGAGAPPWLRNTGLMLDAAGFIAVNANLQSAAHAEVFAAGDCATMHNAEHPKSGVYAVRQGPLLAANLQRALAGEAPLAYRPQRRALALISTGDRYAVASYGSLALAGKWVWRWKDYVDRGFMARYAALRSGIARHE